MDRRDHILNSQKQSSGLHKYMILTIMVSIGLVLFAIEIYLPQPIPGGKIGLSQIVTLLVLIWFGWVEALVVVLIRIIIGNLILGTLFNPIFILSFTGAIVSLLIMALIYNKFKKFSIIGISIFGAVFHNSTQLILAYWIFIRRSELFWLLPYFIWTSLLSGLLIGLTAWYVQRKLILTTFKFVK